MGSSNFFFSFRVLGSIITDLKDELLYYSRVNLALRWGAHYHWSYRLFRTIKMTVHELLSVSFGKSVTTDFIIQW